MAKKKQISTTIKQENKDWLDNNVSNISWFIDGLLDDVRKSDTDREDVAIEARKRVLKIQQQVIKKEIAELKRIEEVIDDVLEEKPNRKEALWKFDLAEMDYRKDRDPGPVRNWDEMDEQE